VNPVRHRKPKIDSTRARSLAEAYLFMRVGRNLAVEDVRRDAVDGDSWIVSFDAEHCMTTRVRVNDDGVVQLLEAL
jgi:hypothetical protein